MSRVVLEGWEPGLKKVGLTKLIRMHSELDLASAKGVTDALLDGEAVAIDCPDAEAAAVLLRGSISLGVARGELGDAAGARVDVR